MRFLRLYITNFMCHSNSFIDLTKFNSALIVGKKDNNDSYSNGVGKSTIFRAIEYVLFNQADVNLEELIKDDSDKCNVVIDFIINDQEYRLSRTRTKKGSSDITLLVKSSAVGDEFEMYHDSNFNPINNKKYWNDISSRRPSDTEKDIAKLIKINFKSFRNTIHFLQNDFGGLSTATAEKRKLILKEVLSLAVYSKLEKISKDKQSFYSKEIDKKSTLIENLSNIDEDLSTFKTQKNKLNSDLKEEQSKLDLLNNDKLKLSTEINDLNNNCLALENSFKSMITKKQSSVKEKNNILNSINEYNVKCNLVSNNIKSISLEIEKLSNKKAELDLIDLTNISKLEEDNKILNDNFVKNNTIINSETEKYKELSIPMPKDSVCKHCRQELSEQHRKDCQIIIDNEIAECKNKVLSLKKENELISTKLKDNKSKISKLNLDKTNLDNIISNIKTKSQELDNKKSLKIEYESVLNNFNLSLVDKEKELLSIEEELKKSSLEESEKIKELIGSKTNELKTLSANIDKLVQTVNNINKQIAVIENNIKLKNEDKIKKQKLKEELKENTNKHKVYSLVTQSFSSSGIPNLIIQNVLDDLQIESNKLLEKLMPGLQLEFFTEKTKGDDTQDTLGINYFVNGKARVFEQLSGAMKLVVAFSLKLGLSFLLQKMMGTDIKLLMLDEIDQSLDRAGVNAFADIVKYFQKDYTILVITHRDYLKDKFDHAILVQQDMSGVSTARVVSSW